MSLWLLIPVPPPLPPAPAWWSHIDWLLVFNGILAFTAIAGIVFLWRQVSLAREQLTLAENQFTEAKKQIAASASDTANMIANAAEQAKAMVALATANEASVAVMLRQLEAYERPWVTAWFEASSPIQFGMADSLWVGFKMWLENIGHSIATHISFAVEIVPVDLIPTDYRRVVSTQDSIAQRLKPDASGPVLFAGDKVPKFVRLNLVEVAKYAVDYEGERYLSLCLAVVIKYSYPTSDREHTTRIGFIFGNEKEPIEGWLLVKLGEELPPEKITILRLPSGGGAD